MFLCDILLETVCTLKTLGKRDSEKTGPTRGTKRFSQKGGRRGGRAQWRAPPRGRSGRARRRDRPPSRRGLDPRTVAMGCAASAQVRPGVSVNGDDAASSPFRGASTSGRDHRGRHPADAASETTVAYVAAHDDFASPAKASAPWMAASDSPPFPLSPEPVTEGLFGEAEKNRPRRGPRRGPRRHTPPSLFPRFRPSPNLRRRSSPPRSRWSRTARRSTQSSRRLRRS